MYAAAQGYGVQVSDTTKLNTGTKVCFIKGIPKKDRSVTERFFLLLNYLLVAYF
jgi:hypothetical protein